jgi:hypothetical protein
MSIDMEFCINIGEIQMVQIFHNTDLTEMTYFIPEVRFMALLKKSRLKAI